jgi:RNA polymerase sigma-70 factor (ECF subfamily)
VDEASGDLLARWQGGDQDAAGVLFRRYAERLIALTRKRLSARLNARVDPEDVVQSAYRSFFHGARDDRFHLERGGDLWRLLVAITLHKLNDQVKRHTSQKRSLAAEKLFCSEDSLLGLQGGALASEPSSDQALALADELEHVMAGLLPVQRQMLELRLQGHNLEEIAEQTGLSRRTVRRVLERIKSELAERHAERLRA